MEFQSTSRPRPVRMPIVVNEGNDQFTPSQFPTLEQLLAWEEEASTPTVIPPVEQPIAEELVESAPFAWEMPEQEGQLAIDVYETDEQIVMMSAIAGVRAPELELTLQQDMLTIRGTRQLPPLAGEPLIQECYWGKFSRTIILPHAVDPSSVSARLNAGILTVTLDKLITPETITVIETDEERFLDPEL